MSKIENSFLALVLCFFLLGPQVCIADEADVLIPSVNPDALLILDLSFSMACDTDGNDCTDTSGTHSGSRLYMAKQAIKTILDYNGDGTIDASDETGLGVRIGYMSFVGCSSDDTGGDWNSGCNAVRVRFPAPTNTPPFASPSRYSDVFSAVNGASTTGTSYTPLVTAMTEAKTYLDDTKTGNPSKSPAVLVDSYKDCRQKFAILITDGRDTCSCGGPCNNNDRSDAYKTRRNTVVKAQALAAAGYKIFVIGFGASMPTVDKNTLNWAAYYGGTDNPRETKSPLIDGSHPPAITPDSNPCKSTSDNDPGSASLTGYAFTATDTASLQDALLTAFDAIKNSIYSFSVTSVSSSRTALDNFVYAASFQPKGDPFWPGFITRSTINTDGSLTAGWEAGGILNGNSSRNIQTYTGGSVTAFQGTAWGTWTSLLGVDTNTVKMIIPYIRGDATPDNWKLGDIFHSNPITIGKPNPYFEDPRDTNIRYYLYRNKSAIQNRAKIIVAGVNDGQLHAFNGDTGSEVWSFIPPNLLPKLRYLAHASHPTSLTHQFFVDGPISAADVWVGTGDGKAKGDNEWSTYLIFGEGKGVRDNTSSAGNTSYLWSSSQYCDQNFNSAYVWTSSYKYYCGYHALDVTATGSTPAYKWLIHSDLDPLTGINSSHGPYLGEPWSKMAIGKVLISGNEKWVGFIGGGYSQSGTAGKGFFAVDLKDGRILWSYTNHDNSAMNAIPASPTIVDTDNDGFIDTAYVGDLSGNMWRFAFCTQAQGSSCGTGSGSGNWSGGLFFQPSTTVPIYTAVTFARDWNSNLWVFWGTGDKMTPNNTSSNSAGKFFAVKDNSRSGNWTESNLQDITSAMYTTDATTKGWYISLVSGGEKMLSDPTVFGGMVLLTSYIPYTGTNPCATAGTAYLYAVAMQKVFVPGATYNTGAGLLGSGARSVLLGSGLASAPTIAQSSPGTTSSLFVSVSGGEGIVGTTATTLAAVTKTKADFDSTSGLIKRLGETGVSTQILHWKDGRIQ